MTMTNDQFLRYAYEGATQRMHDYQHRAFQAQRDGLDVRARTYFDCANRAYRHQQELFHEIYGDYADEMED